MARNENIKKLTLAAMLAAVAFICFSYLRIEVPMGGGMTGKIYIGHAFIILSAFLLGAKYGGLTKAINGVQRFLNSKDLVNVIYQIYNSPVKFRSLNNLEDNTTLNFGV